MDNDLEIDSYEEWINGLRRFHETLHRCKTFIKHTDDGRDLLYEDVNSRVTYVCDLKESYEKYVEGAKHFIEYVKKWIKEHESSNG